MTSQRILTPAVLFVALLLPLSLHAAPNNLKEVMIEIETDMHSLLTLMMREDLKGISKTAKRIANHSQPPAHIKQVIVQSLGKEMKEFKQHDLKVHNSAMEISKAADRGSMPDVVKHYNQVVQGCYQCHQQFRERVRKLLH